MANKLNMYCKYCSDKHSCRNCDIKETKEYIKETKNYLLFTEKELQIYKNTVTNIKDIMSGDEPLDNYEMLSQISNILMGHAYYLSELEEGNTNE